MLQIKCPECGEIISSPFLVEIGSISCNQCKENVTVKDVLVTTKRFTMHRDSLLGRVSHYRTLLETVEREKKLQGDGDGPPTAAQKIWINTMLLSENYWRLQGEITDWKSLEIYLLKSNGKEVQITGSC